MSVLFLLWYAKTFIFLKNCWSSVVASVVLPQLCNLHSALKILHVGEDISSRGFFFFFSGFFGGGFPPFFFFFGGLGWRIILLGVL